MIQVSWADDLYK